MYLSEILWFYIPVSQFVFLDRCFAPLFLFFFPLVFYSVCSMVNRGSHPKLRTGNLVVGVTFIPVGSTCPYLKLKIGRRGRSLEIVLRWHWESWAGGLHGILAGDVSFLWAMGFTQFLGYKTNKEGCVTKDSIGRVIERMVEVHSKHFCWLPLSLV